MSELIDQRNDKNLRRQLLTTASALVLVLYGAESKAEDTDRPTVWIEIGGQLERMPRFEDSISPTFAVRTPRPSFETVSPLSLLQAPRYATGVEGKLTFEPSGSAWVFSAAVRYGRSNGKRHFHNQTYTPTHLQNLQSNGYVTPGRFQDVTTKFHESHTVLDFAVGRDVGLGLFGTSVANLGVRYAQFSIASTIGMSSKPDFIKIRTAAGAGKYFSRAGFHNYTADSNAERSFHGMGPSLSFNGSVPLTHREDSGLAFDWGVNGALLFGKQKAAVSHHTYGRYAQAIKYPTDPHYDRPHHRTSSRSVTVPNLGGFAGLSMRYTNAKISFGYRADVFFGAMDGGIDARREYNRTFYGPFATISIGLGG